MFYLSKFDHIKNMKNEKPTDSNGQNILVRRYFPEVGLTNTVNFVDLDINFSIIRTDLDLGIERGRVCFKNF